MTNLKEFLNLIHTEGYLEVRKIKGKKSIPVFYSSVDEIDFDELKRANKKGFNIYYGALPRKERGSKKEHVVDYADTIYTDIDVFSARKPEEYVELTDKEIMSECLNVYAQVKGVLEDNHLLPPPPENIPTVVIYTGRGIQLVLKLSEPVPVDEIERMNKALMELLRSHGVNADAVWNRDRILRCPTFDNVKEPERPLKTQITHFNPEVKIDLSTVRALAKMFTAEKAVTKAKSTTSKDVYTNGWGIPLDEIRTCDERLNELLRGPIEYDYPSRSEADLAVAAKLWYYRFTIEDIKNILQEYRGYEKTERDDYLEGIASKVEGKRQIAKDKMEKLLSPSLKFEKFTARVRVKGGKVFAYFENENGPTVELYLGSSKTDYIPNKATSNVRAALESIDVEVERGEPNKIIMQIKQKLQSKESQDQLAKAEVETKEPEALKYAHRIKVDDTTEIESTGKGVFIVKEQEKGGKIYENKTKVFTPLSVEQELSVDGMTIYQVRTERKAYRGVATELLDYLRQEGVILARNKAPDVLNCLLQLTDCEKKVGHGAIGVYPNGKNLQLVVDPFTITRDQEAIVSNTRQAQAEKLTRKKVENYLKLIDFWHDYEIYPVMGLSVIAPFSLIFRQMGWIVPFLFHVSPEPGLGKTETQRCFSEKLFGLKEVQANAYESPFRFCTLFDQACLPQTVAEAEKFNWKKMFPLLQSGAEQWLLDVRGLPSLDTRRYLSRAVLLFSGNALGITRKPLLIRFIVLEFDRNAKDERIEKRGELRKIIRQLRPIGFRIVEEGLNHYQSIEDIVNEVEEIEEAISERYNFDDARRSWVWALPYWGLKLWELVAQKVGVNWRAPQIDEFVRDVVTPSEYRIFESVEAQHDSFLSFFYSWMTKNTYTEKIDGESVERVKGDGELFKRGEVEEYQGAWITKSLLDEYRNDSRGQRVPIESLSDLARAVGSKYGLNPELGREIYKNKRFTDTVQKAVFVPYDDKSGGSDEDDIEKIEVG